MRCRVCTYFSKSALPILIACFVIFRQCPVYSADFIIVSSPNSISLLNHFEQPVSTREIQEIGIDVPFRVVKQNATLGDQITPALIIELTGKKFFLQKNDAAIEKYTRIFKGCIVLNDTFQVNKGMRVDFYSTYPAAGRKMQLSEGMLCERILDYNGFCYIKQHDMPVYGWCTNSSSKWHKITGRQIMDKVNSSDTLSSDMQKRIESIIDSANTAYSVFFEHFNNISGQEKQTPVWIRKINRKMVFWELCEPYKTNKLLDASSRELAQQISMLLMGKNHVASFNNGRLSIEKTATGR